MTSRCVNPKRKQTRLRPAYLAVASLAALIAAGDDAGARSGRSERPIEFDRFAYSAGESVMAIVFVSQPADHRPTMLKGAGSCGRRCSSGSKERDRDAAANIFSVIRQKVEEHYSNRYDDAFMPHMQCITWTRHRTPRRRPAGAPRLPTWPASGCLFNFAERLFDATAMGMRVIVAPGDAAPIEFAHPPSFQPRPGTVALAASRAAEGAGDGEEGCQGEAHRRDCVPRRSRGRGRRGARWVTRSSEPEFAIRRLSRLYLVPPVAVEAKEQAEDARAQVVSRDCRTAGTIGRRQDGFCN